MKTIRIGTRASALAMAQTHMVIAALKGAHPDAAYEIVTIDTVGDASQKDNLNLQKIGGKGLFVAALNHELEAGRVDLLVHSMKDVPSIRPPQFVLAAMLPRGDARDSFLCNIPGVARIEDLPKGAIIGTASPRRAAIAKRKRPDLIVVNFRGNVPTRLEKLKNGIDGVAATFLARIGLERLGLGGTQQTILSPDEFLPAAGQAAVGIEIMAGNTALFDMLQTINCSVTHACVTAERAALAVLDGDCKTSISAYAIKTDEMINLRAELYAPDGSDLRAVRLSGAEAAGLGTQAGRTLLDMVDPSEYQRFNILAPA